MGSHPDPTTTCSGREVDLDQLIEWELPCPCTDVVFNPTTDIRNLQIFLAEMRDEVSQAGYFQFGDLMWRVHYAPNRFDGATDLQIWDDADGRIGGFTHYAGADDNPEFFLRPELYDSPMASEMIDWAVARARMGEASRIETSCIDADEPKAAFLSKAGFKQFDDPMVFMARSMDIPCGTLDLPADYAIVSHRDRPDLPGVTGVPIAQDAYSALCRAPGYRDELGLRICYQEREIVAGCICWHDDVGNCGEFEPVGTAEGHRGKGLAFAVMAQTLENLSRTGAEVVYVRTGKANAPAIRLYQKLGFVITDEDQGWMLAL